MPDAVQLGDTVLEVVPEVDDAGGPDALIPGFGNTMRDGLGVRAERGGVDVAITNGLVLDPVLGVRRTSIGVKDGRVVSIGRAGNPDTMDGVEVVHAPGEGDDTITAIAGAHRHVVVVTADRELAERVRAVDAEVVGPSWLLDQLVD